MTRYELERHLGKYVEIVLFDGTVIEGILHKTGEKAFENDANLSIPKLRYFCTCGDKVVYQVINNHYQFENYCPHCGARMDKEENND